MLPKQCPKCGKADEASQFIGAFCKPCFALHHKTYSIDDLEVDECSKCGSVRQGNDWVKHGEEVVKKAVLKSIKSNYPSETRIFLDRDSKGFLATADIRMEVEGHAVEAVEKIRVQSNKTQCPSCSHQSGGYHEAIVQLRGPNHEKLAEKITADIEQTSFITAITAQKNGVDLMVGSKKVALEAVTATRKKFTTTSKLITEKDGKKIYRTTILIRS